MPDRILLQRLAVAALAAGLALAVRTGGAQPASAPSALAGEPRAERRVSGERAELERIVELAVVESRSEPQELLRLTDEALARLAAAPDADLEMRVRALRCDYYNERDRAAAERELEAMRRLAPGLRNPGLRASLLGCEGEMHENSGDNTHAMALYEQAVTVAEAARDDRRLAEALYMRGYLRAVIGDFPQGLADHKRALALYEKLKLPVETRTVTNAVASLYSRMGALDEARSYYEQALRDLSDGASRERVITQHNLGRNFERAGRWEEAQRQFEQTLAQARELDYVRGQVHALRGLAAVRNAKGDGQRALQLIQEAQRLYGNLPDEPLRARLLVQRAVALRLLKRPAEGQGALREAIQIFVAGDAIIEEGQTREELAQNLADLGEWRQAYEQQARAGQIALDLLRRQIDNRFATMKVQFDSEAREREMLMLQREHQASERALAEQQRAARLQIVVAVLASALAALLAALAWRQRRTGQRMRALAMTDDLTGLPNRRQALAALESLIAAGQGGALVILDIDHFKRINDRHGHAAGDSVLRQVAGALQGAAGPQVTLGRLGGEEFVAIAAGASLEQASALAERLRQAAAWVDRSGWLDGQPVTISAGVTVLAPGDTLTAALARADVALYRAKEAGRDRVEALP